MPSCLGDTARLGPVAFPSVSEDTATRCGCQATKPCHTADSLDSEATMQRFHQTEVLAADLDGTLVPLENHARNIADTQLLKQLLAEYDIPLVFVTGRHFEGALSAIEDDQVARPAYIISALGTMMHEQTDTGEFRIVSDYMHHLDQVIANRQVQSLHATLASVDGLRLQGEHCQGPFKLSYYADYDRLETLGSEVTSMLGGDDSPFTVTLSFDPNSRTAYLDVLPRGMSKAYALQWWSEYVECPSERIVFAGDSGNDRDVFTAGYRTIIVANAKPELARHTWEVHRAAGWSNRLRMTQAAGPSGVLEGCRWFDLFPPADSEPAAEIGATPVSYQRTSFRVWAPKREQVAVEITSGDSLRRQALCREVSGYFAGEISGVGPGDTYRYLLDQQLTRPDPASRYQPHDVHGDSQVVLRDNFAWQDSEWPGIDKRDLVIYELHIGTFTADGTFLAAIERIPYLLELGITAVELLPVAQSPGKWNWGYDGVGLFAVQHHYGEPDDLRAFVDACHQAGIAVILDVVYNHLGPEGNYLADFAPYFSHKHGTPWGPALDYDSRRAQPVRDFVIANVLSWLSEYHLDGLRLDAVHFLFDDRDVTILDEIRAAVRAYERASQRRIHLIAEANIYDEHLLDRGRESEAAYEAIWCDDIMQSLYSLLVPDVQLTPRTYHGSPDLAEALEHGYLYTAPQAKRVTPADRQQFHPQGDKHYLHSLVVALQTHDAVGNHPNGARFHQLTSPETQQAAAALFLLYPSIPLMFMGEENATTARFPFFVDFHDPGLRRAVDRGRAREYPQHAWEGALSPSDPAAFAIAKCADADSQNATMFAWYRELLRLRRDWIAEGWLQAARFAIANATQHNVFGYRYQLSPEDHLFVLAHLGGPRATGVQIQLPNDATVWLDSLGEAAPGEQLQIAPNTSRVIVGRGHPVLSPGH